MSPRAAYVWGRPRNTSTPRLSFGSLPPRFSPRREGDEPKGSQRESPGTRRAEYPKIVVSRKLAQRDSAKEHPGYPQTHPLAAQRAPDCDQRGTDRVRSTLPTPRRGSARGAKQSDPLAAWFLDGPPRDKKLKSQRPRSHEQNIGGSNPPNESPTPSEARGLTRPGSLARPRPKLTRRGVNRCCGWIRL